MKFFRSLLTGITLVVALLLAVAIVLILLPVIIVLVIVALVLDGIWHVCVDRISLSFFEQKRGGVFVAKSATPARTATASRNLILYFHGIVADGVGPVEEVINAWLERGDVRVIGYRRPSGKGNSRFDGDLVANAVARHIIEEWFYCYDTITLYGGSLGGGVAADVVTAIKNDAEKASRVIPKLRLIVQDAPTGKKDFQSPLDMLSLLLRGLPFGPISNLLSGFVMGALFIGPQEKNIEPEVNRERLQARVKAAQSFSLSFYRDQILSMINRKPLEAGSLADIPLVYIRSTRDVDTVRETAADAWYRASWSGQSYGATNWFHVTCDSTHLGIGERPWANIESFWIAANHLALPT